MNNMKMDSTKNMNPHNMRGMKMNDTKDTKMNNMQGMDMNSNNSNIVTLNYAMPVS